MAMTPQDWIKLGELGIDLFSAKDKRDKQLNYGELYKMMNPNVYSPTMNTTSTWDANTKTGTQTREFSPEVQAMFESITGQLGAGRQPRTTSRAADELQNANMNWQRERYGLGAVPVEYNQQERTGGYDSTVGGDVGGGGSDGGGGDGGYVGNNGGSDNGNRDAMDDIQRAIREREAQEWRDSRTSDRIYDDPYSGGTMGRDNRWNAGNITDAFLDRGGNRMYNDIGSLALSNAADALPTGGAITGSILSSMSGIPGFRQALRKGGQALQDWVYDNYTFMNPVNPADPYGLSQDANVIPTGENLPRSGMYEGNTNPATGGRGSYSGGGNFNSGNFANNYGRDYSSISDAQFGSPTGGTLGGRWGSGGSMGGGADEDWWRRRRGGKNDGEDKE